MSTYNVYWLSEDKQAHLHGGEYATHEDAERSIPAFRLVLLAQCGSDEARQAIDAGTYEIEERQD